MSKPKVEERPTVLLGRPSNNVSIGIVGMPNIGKCFARGTPIRLYDGSLLPVERISALARLMGDDGLPRVVTPGSLMAGRAPLYTVTPDWDGMAPFTVNGDHILVLQCSERPQLQADTEGGGGYSVSWYELSTDNVVSRAQVRHAALEAAQAELKAALAAQPEPLEWEVSVDDFLAYPPSITSVFHVIASPAVTFASTALPSLADSLTAVLGVAPTAAQEAWAAWYLGLWLTAGAADGDSITLATDAAADCASRLLHYQALFAEAVTREDDGQFSCFTFGSVGSSLSIARRLLSAYDLLLHRHFPQAWLCDSVDVRLRILAGVLDGRRQPEGEASLSSPSRSELEALKLIAASLGLRSRIGQQADGSHRLHLSGDLASMLQHCTTAHLQTAQSSGPAWCSRSSGFRVKECGVGDYFGFAVHGGANQRFLLADFTVTHNSSLFNCLSNLNVPAENYPFCTIDPSNARVPVPDDRFDFLCATFKPASKVPAVLTITDIAGLVKGANEGKGLGNAFLSHIQAVDAIFHLVRAFKDKEIEHVEGSVDPIRDLDIIAEELILKDYSRVHDRLDVVKRLVEKGQDKSKKQDVATLTIADQLLEEKKDIRSYKWKPDDIDVLNELQLLTAKPVVYLVNIGEDEYYQQKNKWLGKIKEWTTKRDPASKVIPFSVVYEAKITAFGADEEARKAFISEKKVPSQMPKIITTGYHALDLIHFFTAGEDEVRGWTIKRGTLAPAAAGVIHTDFQKAFIAAEVMAFDDFKEAGSEAAVKAAGKYRTKGKDYTCVDGDIMFFKHNAGGAAKKK